MTITEVCHIEIDDLASPYRFYPAEIKVPHPQLRNFISLVNDTRLYYVHDYDIFVLNLETQQSSLVATVPFEAKCLAAAHGWICVGGEIKGDCAFVRIGTDESESDYFGLDLIVDMLGTEIVNSMTIHKLPAQHHDKRDEVVVLISNNDRSVTLYSLSQQKLLAVLKHPNSMNYATMSPDHTLIAAVGDSDEVFFYQRKELDQQSSSSTDLRDFAEYTWHKIAVPKIPSGEGVTDDYGFAVAFSSNGRLCAVSAQGGYISILDIELLLSDTACPENAVRCTFKSSRNGLWGCVRSMAFSPDPWDMLAWTEDHGRAGVADLRRLFSARQCLALDQGAAETIQLKDITPAEYKGLDVKERLKQQHLQRMRNYRGLVPSGSVERPQVDADASHAQPMDLDARERHVLEALEQTMSDVEHRSLRPYSVHYTASSAIRSSAVPDQSREYDVQLLNPGAQLQIPRRRGSVILTENASHRNLAPPENTRAVMTASPAPISDDNTSPPMSTNDLTPTNNTSLSHPMPYNIPPSDPWHVIEAALASNRDSQSSSLNVTHDQPTTLAQVDSAILAERRMFSRLERQLADERRLSALLRIELEARERLLESRHQATQSEDTSEGHLANPLDRVPQTQLQSEQENGRQRSNELESELRVNNRRVERLVDEREHLMSRMRQQASNDSITSATSFALPTTTSSRADSMELETMIRHTEAERRAQRQRIQDLETQFRRAETRVELASAHSDSANRAELRDRNSDRLLDARFLSATRSSGSAGTLRRLHNGVGGGGGSSSTSNPASSPSAVTNRIRGAAIRRAEAATNLPGSSTIPASSELSNRVTDSEMRIARMMMLQRATLDANGNWMAGHGLQRILGPRRMMASTNLAANQAHYEEMMRDKGIGTAGIGWSSDGRYLFVGSQQGIHQFKIQTKGRMCFPSVQMR